MGGSVGRKGRREKREAPTGPMVTLDDGRVVPPITLDDGRLLIPTKKPNGEVETNASKYTDASYSSHTTSPTISSAPTAAAFVNTVTGVTYVMSGGQVIPVPYTKTYTNYPSVVSTSQRTDGYFIGPTDTPFPGPITLGDSGLDKSIWEGFSKGVRAAIVISIIIGFFAVIVACVWICCGLPKKRKAESKERESMRLEMEREATLQRGSRMPLGASVEQLGVPLRTMSTASREREQRRVENQTYAVGGGRNVSHTSHGSISRVASRLGRHMSLRGGGGDAPPRYEEVVPPAHQHLAGGMRHNRNAPSYEQEDDGQGLVADGKMPLSEIPFEDVVLESRSEASSSRDFGERHARGGGDTRGHTNS